MKLLSKFSIRYQIFLGYILIIGLFSVLAVQSAFLSKSASTAIREIERRNAVEIDLTANLQVTALRISNDIRLMHLMSTGESLGALKKHTDLYLNKFVILLREFEALFEEFPSAPSKERIDLITALFHNFNQVYQKAVEGHSADVLKEASADELESVKVMDDIVLALGDMRDENIASLSISLGKVIDAIFSARSVIVVLIMVALCLAVFLAITFSRSILQPIRELIDMHKKFANGVLDIQIKEHRGDEVGELQSGFISMVNKIKQSYLSLEIERQDLDRKVRDRTKALESNQNLLREITEGIHDAVMLIDAEHTVLWANKKVSDLYGVRPDMIVGRKCQDAIRPQQGPAGQVPPDTCFVDEAKKARTSISRSIVVKDTSGGLLHLRVDVYPITAEDNKMQFIVVSRDITEDVKHQEKIDSYINNLERKESQYRGKLEELERFARLSVDRETKMMELKKRIKELEDKCGQG